MALLSTESVKLMFIFFSFSIHNFEVPSSAFSFAQGQIVLVNEVKAWTQDLMDFSLDFDPAYSYNSLES